MQATHEIYAYIDVTGEPLQLTDPIKVERKDNELYDEIGQLAGLLERTDGAGGETWTTPNRDTTLLLRSVQYHEGDPCIHCGKAHDDVPAGPCKGADDAG